MDKQKRLKEVRMKTGLSQNEFSERINVAQSTYAQFETGRRELKDIHIVAICREFDIDKHWFETGKGNMRNETLNEVVDSLATQYGLNELEKTLIMEYGKLKKEHKEVFRAFFDNVVNSMSETAAPKESLTAEEMSQALKVLGTNNKKLI